MHLQKLKETADKTRDRVNHIADQMRDLDSLCKGNPIIEQLNIKLQETSFWLQLLESQITKEIER